MTVFAGFIKIFTPLREIEFKKTVDRQVAASSKIDRVVDAVVRTSANIYTFATIQILLVTWALLGIPYSDKPLWPIVISDAQAIISYVFDTLLMRQLLKHRETSLRFVALMQHHNQTKSHDIATLKMGKLAVPELTGTDDVDDEKPGWVCRTLDRVARATGHIFSVFLFVIIVVIWAAFGPSQHFGSQWQLDMNSASSAWMVFLFSLLAVVHEQHNYTSQKQTLQIESTDAKIIQKLNALRKEGCCGEDTVYMQVDKQNWWQEVILFYAHIVGGFVGIVILIAVFAVWIAIGPLLKFSDSWWLAIGTYSGLIGLFDSFVLRNVQMLIGKEQNARLDDVQSDDQKINASFGIPVVSGPVTTISLTQRLSQIVCRFSADQLTVFAGLLICVSLLIGASALKWSLTGQLLCNVPPSILESFLMQILITGHLDNAERHASALKRLHRDRQHLLRVLETYSAVTGL